MCCILMDFLSKLYKKKNPKQVLKTPQYKWQVPILHYNISIELKWKKIEEITYSCILHFGENGQV